MKPATIYLAIGGALALAAGVYVWRKGGIAQAAQSLGSGAVGAVGGVASGAVLGLGDALGLQRTDETECARALREGRTWDASFACPAADFLRGTFSSSDNAGTSQSATTGRIVTPPAAARDEITDLFLDPYGYSNPI